MTDVKETSEKQSGTSEFSAPAETIENCKGIVEKLYNIKADSVVTAEEVWAILGPRGTMGQKISACIQYGLMENNTSGKGYRISDFGVSVIKPEYTEPAFIKKKLLEAFSTPPLYKKLTERYNSKGLPNQQGLTNILVTEFGLNKNSTGPKASSVFLENCNFLNVNDGGRMKFFMPNVNISDNKDESVNNRSQDSVKKQDEVVTEDETIILIPLKKGEKKARLILPNGFDDKDLSRISKFVEALKDE